MNAATVSKCLSSRLQVYCFNYFRSKSLKVGSSDDLTFVYKNNVSTSIQRDQLPDGGRDVLRDDSLGVF